MTDVTATPSAQLQPSRRRFARRAAIAILIAGVGSVIGVQAVAHGPGGWHRGGFLATRLDPAALDQRLEHMLRHLYVEIDATDAEKQQLAPIVKAAAADLLPLRGRMHDARRQAVELLARDPVDRAALEALRVDQLRLAEQASQRFVRALADAADVLTPEQRKQLAGRLGRWHGGAQVD